MCLTLKRNQLLDHNISTFLNCTKLDEAPQRKLIILLKQIIPVTLIFTLFMVNYASVAIAEGEKGSGGIRLYVAINGNDQWSGRLPAPDESGTDGPFASIKQARDRIRELKYSEKPIGPVTVLIRGGIYYIEETIRFGPQDSGTQDAPVSYIAYPGEKPELVGGRRITGFKPVEGGMVSVRLPEVKEGKWYFRQLFVDGKRQTRARYPNADPADPYRGGFLYTDTADPPSFDKKTFHPTEFIYKPGDFILPISRIETPDAEVHIFPSGPESCRAFQEIVNIKNVDEDRRMITVQGKECVAGIGAGDRYFVENVFEALDSPGEWYLNKETGVLYYQPTEGFSEQSEVIAPVVGRLIEVIGESAPQIPVTYLRFAGFTIRATDYSPDDDGCIGFGMGNNGVLHFRNVIGCIVEDCTFTNIGKYAVSLTGGENNHVIRNEISGSAEGGVLVQNAARNTVSDNHIHNCGAVCKHIGGVVLTGEMSDGNVISHNYIHDISRYGISLKNPGSHNVLEFNRIHHTNTETYDSGGIEVSQHDRQFRSHSIIRNNVVGDTIGYSFDDKQPVFMSWGIYLDSYAGGYTVVDNITYRNSHGGIMLQGGKDNIVQNNVFVDSSRRQVSVSNHMNNSTGVVFEKNIVYFTDSTLPAMTTYKLSEQTIQIDNNLYFTPSPGKLWINSPGVVSFADWVQKGYDVHSIIADPLFVDKDKDNYTLKMDSPAFNLGFRQIDISTVGPRSK
jgi:parallel beta-helix repeat protein